jgi:hypothetical protein
MQDPRPLFICLFVCLFVCLIVFQWLSIIQIYSLSNSMEVTAMEDVEGVEGIGA